MSPEVVAPLHTAILELDMDAALASVRPIIEAADSAAARDAVDAIAGTLQVVGKRFQEGEWFVGELVYAGEIAKSAIDLLSPLLSAGPRQRLGTVVVGTVAGDLHDLGKNIFVSYARSAGLDIVDLGVDVAVGKFVAAVKEHQPLSLGLSCLLTTTAGQIAAVVAALEREGLRQELKVIVGGAAVTDRLVCEAGADAFAPDAVTGTDIIRAWSASQ